MQFFKYSIPIAALVGTLAWIMLENNYEEVPWDSRVWITFGAAALSGVLAFFFSGKKKKTKSIKRNRSCPRSHVHLTSRVVLFLQRKHFVHSKKLPAGVDVGLVCFFLPYWIRKGCHSLHIRCSINY